MNRILILCNGNPPSRQLLEEHHRASDYLIAADGGGNVALSMGVAPDIVIGDLDSFKENGSHSFDIIRQADQETNDLEKALLLARREGGRKIDILGATGLRLDHTLKNLSVLKQFNDAFHQISIIDDFGQTLLLPRTFRSPIGIGTPVSLFPLSGKVTGITTAGLQYPLRDGILENGVRDGSSNKVVESPVEISYKQGDLLLFIARKPLR
ncbi:thiamine diphosphokinase [Fodinibius sediminis]|uniref:Thiamine diphosphokinase n=1 Tax=Fodinibius sediminis TaxID=1214077 RepID=A0A521AIL3_9BACT|nr:thiamine diphosphokinase [Fodinibius sediminis]SMO34530.1 thiamine diphosphokinase [Fodinibius sediminis]